MKSITNLISIALIGGGAAGFAISSQPLLASREADVPLNVLGINRSPYGEVFAMAMQGPIDTYFHAAEDAGNAADGEDEHEHEHASHGRDPAKGVSDKVLHLIEGMADGLTERTNPYSATDAHKFYLRRGIEDKLRFAYNLDPGHYANYNAYHFFLTEPELGTRPELTPMAAKLANDTINYCLSRHDDPRLALTAAAASTNVMDLMFNDRQLHPRNPRFSIADMRKMLDVTDRAIVEFAAICDQWTEQGLWDNLSGMRLMEIEERAKFVMKVRASQAQAIAILSATPFDYGVTNPAGIWRSVNKRKPDPFSYGAIPPVESPGQSSGKSGASPSAHNTAGNFQ